MCTIGAVFDGNQLVTFKQCDLIPVTHFHPPRVRRGQNGVESYIAMTREGSEGIWAGSNDAGVSFAAADSYTTTAANYSTSQGEVQALFEAYEATVRDHTNATEAAMHLTQFYLSMGQATPFPAPDIALVSGWADETRTRKVAIFIEYMPNPYNQRPVRTICRDEGYFVSTNHFRLQPDSVHYPANHSTYLRLNRAESLLQLSPNQTGVEQLLSDQYYGQTELSLCRETEFVGSEFFTQATALFSLSQGRPTCRYQVNGNPRTQPLQTFQEAPL
ncbi:hypothetical protein [Vibrio coralliilyticus]|uniref:hypothetical protein n=1 Tax=Vibrio coralliilyticus TaxID=190893 RepID=UPI001560028A|nr:hypothetical protein [Vibrio coralliilyticus]NRF32026.1 hypothetical protein [Vibrio coralliilyticus]NRF55118.1 hypothetical protein [Vibrio coralliilyticus]